MSGVVRQHISARILPPGARGNSTARLIFTGPVWDAWKHDIFFCIHGELLTLACGLCDTLLLPRHEVSLELAALDAEPLRSHEVARLLGLIFHGEHVNRAASGRQTPEIPPKTPEILHEVLSSLPLRNRLVLRLVLRGKSAAEIGLAVGQSDDRNAGISATRVGQLAKQGVRMLRHPLRVKRIVSSLPMSKWSGFLRPYLSGGKPECS